MGSPIQKWCQDSFVATHRQALQYVPNSPTNHLNDIAEKAVELTVFRRLAAFRGIPEHEIEPPLVEVEAGFPIDFSELIASCPIDHDAPINILQWLHEYLVSRRRHTTDSRVSTSRKKGGVFYTPQPVVDYILQHTLRSRLNNTTAEQAARLTLLDPSAGSGAFLVSAYRMLLDWHLQTLIANDPASHHEDILRINEQWRLTRSKCRSILRQHIFGIDLDPAAVLVTRRALWLTMIEASAPDRAEQPIKKTTTHLPATDAFSTNVLTGHALVGRPFGEPQFAPFPTNTATPFHWNDAFPQVAQRGGFDLIVGNPPYRRERQFKQELDEIATTPLGRFRSARMDLWYYFVHRGIELLRENGALSFITNAYWLKGTGAEKLIAALRDDVQVDEILLLHNQPVFPSVSGQHLIFRLTKALRIKTDPKPDIVIKVAPSARKQSLDSLFVENSSFRSFKKPSHLLFHGHQLDVRPDATEFLDKLRSFSRLGDLGNIRQGIAENPASVNRRTLERFASAADTHRWRLGEGVFALKPDEVDQLNLSQTECELLRPYHTLTDLGRYWLATEPSRKLLYSTRDTCADIASHNAVRAHLERFRAILESRRETSVGANRWWHLHWPRDEQIWHAPKLVVPQMAIRPSFSVARDPTYVSFSANVFVPAQDTREDLRYLCGLLNSRVLWSWFQHHAKQRGIGVELNGHTLQQAPIPRIDFQNPTNVAQHDDMVQLVVRRMQLEQTRRVSPPNDATEHNSETARTESQIDQLVASLFQLGPSELELVNELTNAPLIHT
ncbi:Eco57I restriction-modification methylase domain-containing protein [Schlesneria paludicola]|uniref:Eco57I restriction-modification methylase domain-containing protein n=1 Tax=Schlesneria paludicola TaxID=360056 RepID=UPI00029A56C9|nr:DNA methyltransferase [Schlesneria paludicola]